MCEDLDLCLSRLHHNSRLSVKISREKAHKSRLISASQIHCFDKSEVIFDYSLKFLMQRNFQYINELNKFIEMATAGGLIKKWHSDSRIRPHDNYDNTKSFRSTKLESYYGILLLWMPLCVYCIFTHHLEITVLKKLRMVGSTRIWVLIEMMIDPYRHFLLKNKGISDFYKVELPIKNYYAGMLMEKPVHFFRAMKMKT